MTKPEDIITEWAAGYSPTVIARVVKRLARFRDNTPDADTKAATSDLIDLIQKVTPNV